MALLNHAVGDPTNRLSNDSAWRLVRPFQDVGRAREVHFSVVQMLQLLDASGDRGGPHQATPRQGHDLMGLG